MKGNTTGNQSIKAGHPSTWIIGNKTGMSEYGTTNDIAIIWPDNYSLLVLARYCTQDEQNTENKKSVLAQAARIVTKPFLSKQ